MPGTEPMPSPSPDPRKRSSLLGPRKSAAPPDKPSLLGRRPASKTSPAEALPASPGPEKPETPVKKAAPKTTRAKAPAPARVTLASLQAQVELLQAALQRCPTWTDLELLESRLSAAQRNEQASAESEKLHETLQNRTEELDELAQINAELQEENEELRHNLALLKQRLSAQLEVSQQAETRLAAAEGLLRESLLSLISPGDEFYEELVEQIQRFLGP